MLRLFGISPSALYEGVASRFVIIKIIIKIPIRIFWSSNRTIGIASQDVLKV